jgi:hypothetical protein
MLLGIYWKMIAGSMVALCLTKMTVVISLQSARIGATMTDEVVDLALPKKQKRGISVVNRETMTDEDERVLVGLILLKKKMPACRVAIHPRVMLPIERVQRMADTLRAVGLLR